MQQHQRILPHLTGGTHKDTAAALIRWSESQQKKRERMTTQQRERQCERDIIPCMIYPLLWVKGPPFVLICLYFYPKFILPSHACQRHTNIILAMRCPITGSYKNWPRVTATDDDAVCPERGGTADFIHLSFSLGSSKEIRKFSSY